MGGASGAPSQGDSVLLRKEGGETPGEKSGMVEAGGQ